MTEEGDRLALYRLKAAEARKLADKMSDDSARAIALDVAATWERLAGEEEKNRRQTGQRFEMTQRED